MENKIFCLILIYALINLFSFTLMGIDKHRAKTKKMRIKESNFFVISSLLGAMGSVFGMTVFRHKTQKKKFYIGIPILYLINLFMLWGISEFYIVK